MKESVEAVQYGKPSKNDPRKTPAKPSERRRGSKKNKRTLRQNLITQSK